MSKKSIKISEDLHKRLGNLGTANESYEMIIERLIIKAEKRKVNKDVHV